VKAVVCQEPFHLNLVSRSEPRPGEGDVLVRIKRVGLCGTDFHIYGGRHPFLQYPRVMGHELAGEVAQAPAGSRFEPGQLVAINPYLFCGSCIACRRGKPNACANVQVLGVHRDGGMCELLAVPESSVLDASGLSLDQAAMLEFLAVGAHAVARARVAASDSVLVVGAGPIGVAVGLFARLNGANVTLVDKRPARLDYARDRLGFERVLAAGPELAGALSEQTQGEMFNMVFDATGAIEAMKESLYYLSHGGTLVFVGVAKGELGFAGPEFHKRETTLLASRNALAEDFERVASAIKAGQIATERLQTHSFRAEEMATRIPELIADADNVLKAIACF
jgi:2-desacetyl-2-hydroxyethyl bacteriochlorophyllide A dehydrogenase